MLDDLWALFGNGQPRPPRQDDDDAPASDSSESYETSDSGGDSSDDASVQSIHSIYCELNPACECSEASIADAYRRLGAVLTLDESALEHLYNDSNYAISVGSTHRRTHYRDLFQCAAHTAVAGMANTFLVDKRLDFIYGYLLEQLALDINTTTNTTTTPELRLSSERLFRARKRALTLCTVQHERPEERTCPLCYVLYTRIDSAFYQVCRSFLSTNAYIDFRATLHEYLQIEHLAFNQVLLLCGESLDYTVQLDPAQGYYEATNQWIKVPIWFLMLLPVKI